MRRMALLSLSVVLLANSPLMADIPAPRKPKPDRTAKLIIEVDARADHPKVIVPVNQLLNRGGGGDGAAPPDLADAGSGTHTLIAGLALTAALTLGGLIVIRRTGSAKLAMLLALGGALGIGAIVEANAPIREPQPEPPQPPVNVNGLFQGEAEVVVTKNGDAIRVVLDRKTLAKLQRRGPGAGALPPGAAPGETRSQPPEPPRPPKED